MLKFRVKNVVMIFWLFVGLRCYTIGVRACQSLDRNTTRRRGSTSLRALGKVRGAWERTSDDEVDGSEDEDGGPPVAAQSIGEG